MSSVDILTFALLATTGPLAGGLVMFTVAVVPVCRAVPVELWVRLHQALDPRIESYMPWLGRSSVVLAVLLTLVAEGGRRASVLAGLLCLAVVPLVSELRNVPMNKTIGSWTPELVPPEAHALLHRWTQFNLVRTVAAVAAFLAFAGSASS